MTNLEHSADRVPIGVEVSALVFMFFVALAPGVAASSVTRAMPAPRTINLMATDAMTFSLPTFVVKPGESVRVVLLAVGSQPADRMSHNFILLKPTADIPTFIMMASLAREEGYLPSTLKKDVIAATSLVAAGESASVTFTAPGRPGEYPYVCSFPGHYNAGMRGTMIVRR